MSGDGRLPASRGWALGLLVLLLVLSSGACALPGQGSKPAAQSAPPVAVDVGTLTTNLADVDPPRLIQVDVVLEVASQAQADQVKSAQPSVRDAILRVLRGSTAKELAGSQGMDAVRARIESEVARAVPNVVVRGVYFTNFVVQ
ncbi:MAG: flagellar basal body-associated FliL family protein [Bacillota bacterium]|nr:flagellar basal body-associated FliL family protein [Bacillota bacterium]